MNGVYNHDRNEEKKEAFARIEQLRKKRIVVDEASEKFRQLDITVDSKRKPSEPTIPVLTDVEAVRKFFAQKEQK